MLLLKSLIRAWRGSQLPQDAASLVQPLQACSRCIEARWDSGEPDRQNGPVSTNSLPVLRDVIQSLPRKVKKARQCSWGRGGDLGVKKGRWPPLQHFQHTEGRESWWVQQGRLRLPLSTSHSLQSLTVMQTPRRHLQSISVSEDNLCPTAMRTLAPAVYLRVQLDVAPCQQHVPRSQLEDCLHTILLDWFDYPNRQQFGLMVMTVGQELTVKSQAHFQDSQSQLSNLLHQKN